MKKFFKKVGKAAGKVADAASDAIDELRETDDEQEVREAVELLKDKLANDGTCPFCGAEPYQGEE